MRGRCFSGRSPSVGATHRRSSSPAGSIAGSLQLRPGGSSGAGSSVPAQGEEARSPGTVGAQPGPAARPLPNRGAVIGAPSPGLRKGRAEAGFAAARGMGTAGSVPGGKFPSETFPSRSVPRGGSPGKSSRNLCDIGSKGPEAGSPSRTGGAGDSERSRPGTPPSPALGMRLGPVPTLPVRAPCPGPVKKEGGEHRGLGRAIPRPLRGPRGCPTLGKIPQKLALGRRWFPHPLRVRSRGTVPEDL